MQNRSAILIFTILLALACLYQLSFSFVTSGLEKDAKKYATSQLDSMLQANNGEFAVVYGDTVYINNESDRETVLGRLESKYLEMNNDKSVYPVLGYSYGFCKRNGLNLGLDLQGGMAVTMEMSIPSLVMNLAEGSKNPAFQAAYQKAVDNSSSNDEFLDEFEKASKDGKVKLNKIFRSGPLKGKFNKNAGNAKIMQVIREEAAKAIENTENIIRTRIDKFGVAQPLVQRVDDNRKIYIELPGVKDPKRVRKNLQATANLEFWEIYPKQDAWNIVIQANQDFSEFVYPGVRDSVQNAVQGNTATKEDAEIATIDTLTVVEHVGDSIFNTLTELQIDSVQAIVDTINEAAIAALPKDTASKSMDDILADSLSTVDIPMEIRRKADPIFANRFQVNASDGFFWQIPSLALVHYEDTAYVASVLRSKNVFIPDDMVFMFGSSRYDTYNKKNQKETTEYIELYALKKAPGSRGPVLTGEAIDDAYQGYGADNKTVTVNMSMNPEGAQAWEEATGRVSGPEYVRAGINYIAISMDNKVFSAPSLSGAISGGRSEISGGFGGPNGLEEATDLANLLNSGSLPARLNIIEESVVGPTLGADNINKGMWSFIIALGAILVYMIFYYGKAGAAADVALVANVFFLFGILAAVKAALTLPGIAGIVLTIGMSVDANVLIFERIREELRGGKGQKLAIADGYKKAYSSIVDANITTLLTAIILATFGSGPVQGFANTLIIGIFTSLFSAIFITRLIFTYMMDKKKEISFSTSMTEKMFTNIKVDWLGKRKLYYLVSGLIVAGGIAAISTKGLDLGVEFTGGTTITAEFNGKAVDIDNLRKELGAVYADEKGNPAVPEVKAIGATAKIYKVKITTNYLNDKQGSNQEIEDATSKGLTALGYEKMDNFQGDAKGFRYLQIEQVAPQISDKLVWQSVIAIVLSLIVIFLYILIRFQKWQFGLGALAAMFHDVMVVLGLFAIFWGVLPFAMEVNQAFIAAILTVVGYSINDTVVVFDRIREFLGLHKRQNAKEVVNSALNSTLSRTINTSMSTFIVLLIIFLFGGDTIQGFIFALLVGVVVGTYSSLCIATPIAYDTAKDSLTLAKDNE